MKIKKILAVLSACTLMTAVSVPAENLIKVSAVSETVTVHTVKAEEFLGTWVCGRCAITISEETDGNGYAAFVHWGSSAATSTEWTYRHCKFSSVDEVAYFICKGEASCSEVTYAEDGTSTVVGKYIEGNGSFSISDNVLTWEEEAEHSGADMAFTKTDIVVTDESAKPYLGTWICDRCTITISKELDGSGYQVLVNWGSSADSSSEWVYRHCTFLSGTTETSFTCQGDATYSEITYLSDGSRTRTEKRITGNAVFKITNHSLTWNDAEEPIGADMIFTNPENYADVTTDKNAKPYLGIWGSQKFSVELSEEADKSGYQIVVLWKSGAATATAWTYHHCAFVEGTTEASFICKGEAYQTEITYAEDGSESGTRNFIAGNAVFSIADGTLVWNDAEIDFSKELTFVKAETGLEIDANAEDYFGIWGSGKCNIQLSKETEGEGYRAVVHWANTAATATEWICKNCTFNVEEAGVSFICNGGVSRMELTFAEDGTEISAETYTKGSSSFIIINDTLTWNDNEEDLGAGMLFEKAQVTYQAGDADGSGEVDILDVITVNKSILGKELMTEAQIKAVDFNGNGKPDSSESLTILKYIVGLITDFHA